MHTRLSILAVLVCLTGCSLIFGSPQSTVKKAAGTVTVQVLVDENGNVISASAISGHSLVRAAAVAAARSAKFPPTKHKGEPVKVSGVINYQFVAE